MSGTTEQNFLRLSIGPQDEVVDAPLDAVDGDLGLLASTAEDSHVHQAVLAETPLEQARGRVVPKAARR